MTKKDYIKIAKILHDAAIRDFAPTDVEWLVDEFIAMLGDDNPLFDSKKFEDAVWT